MLKVAKPFQYNGADYSTGGQVSPALFEADDLAALLHGGFLVDPNAPKVEAPKVEEAPKKKAGRK